MSDDDSVGLSLPSFSKTQIGALIVVFIFIGSSAAYGIIYSTGGSSSDGGTGPSSGPSTANLGPLGGVHEHFTIDVTVNGVSIDFSKPRYQLQDQAFHFEEGQADSQDATGHIHAEGVTLGYAFQTLGMDLTSSCITLADGREFCNSGDGQLTVTVNGQQIQNPAGYEPQDGDVVTVEYG